MNSFLCWSSALLAKLVERGFLANTLKMRRKQWDGVWREDVCSDTDRGDDLPVVRPSLLEVGVEELCRRASDRLPTARPP